MSGEEGKDTIVSAPINNGGAGTYCLRLRHRLLHGVMDDRCRLRRTRGQPKGPGKTLWAWPRRGRDQGGHGWGRHRIVGTAVLWAWPRRTRPWKTRCCRARGRRHDRGRRRCVLKGHGGEDAMSWTRQCRGRGRVVNAAEEEGAVGRPTRGPAHWLPPRTRDDQEGRGRGMAHCGHDPSCLSDEMAKEGASWRACCVEGTPHSWAWQR